jgi:hypothetical protein
MTDDDSERVLEGARPRGSGYAVADRRLVDEMRALRLAGKAPSWTSAAAIVVSRAVGAGDRASKIKRLVAVAKSVYGELSPEGHISCIILPGADRGESDSMPAMSTAAPEQPDLAARLAALESRADGIDREQASMSEQLADLLATVTSMAVRDDSSWEDEREVLRQLSERLAELCRTTTARLDRAGAPDASGALN